MSVGPRPNTSDVPWPRIDRPGGHSSLEPHSADRLPAQRGMRDGGVIVRPSVPVAFSHDSYREIPAVRHAHGTDGAQVSLNTTGGENDPSSDRVRVALCRLKVTHFRGVGIAIEVIEPRTLRLIRSWRGSGH